MTTNRVRETRDKKELSPEGLGYLAGCSSTTVRNIETGRNRPNVYLALSIARVLGSTVEELFGEAS